MQRSSPETQGVAPLHNSADGFMPCYWFCLFVCLGFLQFFVFFLMKLFSVVFYHFFKYLLLFFYHFFLYFLFLSFFFREMVFSKVIDEIALFCRSFVLSQSSAKVSAGFTNVSGRQSPHLFIAYCSLFIIQTVFVFDIRKPYGVKWSSDSVRSVCCTVVENVR